MRAKAISVYQPWATALAVGAKLYETRSFATKHRGLLAIHAAMTATAFRDILRAGGREAEMWREILRVPSNVSLEGAFMALPRGRVIATCQVVACVQAETVRALAIKHQNEAGATWRESEVGDFRGGRWAWQIDDLRRFAAPFQVKGQQGIWEVELPTKRVQAGVAPEPATEGGAA